MTGTLYIITAPSGAGKSSLVKNLLEKEPLLKLSVSYTTRAPRPGEQNGREYHFVDVATFIDMQQRGEFLESAHVHGNYYGTSHRWIAEQMQAGNDVLLEIDWQGAQQVRRIFANHIGIFIWPPSLEELEKRLRSRGQDSEEVIARRVAGAREEMSHVAEFDYVIINIDFNTALLDLQAVIRAARLQFAKQAERYPHHFKT